MVMPPSLRFYKIEDAAAEGTKSSIGLECATHPCLKNKGTKGDNRCDQCQHQMKPPPVQDTRNCNSRSHIQQEKPAVDGAEPMNQCWVVAQVLERHGQKQQQ